MIEVENLKYYFSGRTTPAVNGVSFTVRQGEIFGLLGPNGAGKSTVINILTTVLQPTAGTVRIAGYDHLREARQIRQKIGVVFQAASLDERLTAYENLYYHAKLYHVPSAKLEERIGLGLQLVKLWNLRNEQVMKFSGGMKRRLELARSIIHEPELLILDEPTLGLDPQSRRQIWEYIAKLHMEQSLTVLLTTHYLEEAEICDTIAIIDCGRMIAQDKPINLKKGLGKDTINLQTRDNQKVSRLIKEEFNQAVFLQDGQIQIEVADGTRFLAQLFKIAGEDIIAVDIKNLTLEELFIRLTGETIREQICSETDRLRSAVKSRWLR